MGTNVRGQGIKVLLCQLGLITRSLGVRLVKLLEVLLKVINNFVFKELLQPQLVGGPHLRSDSTCTLCSRTGNSI